MSELSFYLQIKYKNKMLEILDNQELSLVEREFYSESGNWYQNNDYENMIHTLIWLSRNKEEKKEILNGDLDDYFNCE